MIHVLDVFHGEGYICCLQVAVGDIPVALGGLQVAVRYPYELKGAESQDPYS